jgi:hypothetical protein
MLLDFSVRFEFAACTARPPPVAGMAALRLEVS